MERFKECAAVAEFFNMVLDEQEHAENKHDGFPTDRIHASAILAEEAGKLIQACNDFEHGKTTGQEGNKNMERYAARVAAMALCFYQSQPKQEL